MSAVPKPPKREKTARTPIARGTRPKARNGSRRSREWLRAYGSLARVAWVKGLPSVASGDGPCVNAHTRSGGAGRKADAAYIVPLTNAEHQELHAGGIGAFERKYRLNLDLRARGIAMQWQKEGV